MTKLHDELLAALREWADAFPESDPDNSIDHLWGRYGSAFAVAMRKTREALSRPAHPQAGEVVARPAGWTYGFKDGFGTRVYTVLNSEFPSPSKNPPTQHHGGPITDVRPFFYAHPQPHAEDVSGMLADPNMVHINMLRGGIAKPTPAQIGHLYRGEEAAEVIREVTRQNPDAAPHADAILKLISAARRDDQGAAR